MSIAQTTQETLGLMKESLTKNVTLSTGLSAYDLQAPAKNLYPIVTPLRNALPRVAQSSISSVAGVDSSSQHHGKQADTSGTKAVFNICVPYGRAREWTGRAGRAAHPCEARACARRPPGLSWRQSHLRGGAGLQ